MESAASLAGSDLLLAIPTDGSGRALAPVHIGQAEAVAVQLMPTLPLAALHLTDAPITQVLGTVTVLPCTVDIEAAGLVANVPSLSQLNVEVHVWPAQWRDKPTSLACVQEMVPNAAIQQLLAVRNETLPPQWLAGVAHAQGVDVAELEGVPHWVAIMQEGGQSLRDAHRMTPAPMPLDSLIEWLVPALQAVLHLKRHGRVHLAITPDALRMDPRTRQVRLCDLWHCQCWDPEDYTVQVGTQVHAPDGEESAFFSPEMTDAVGLGEVGEMVRADKADLWSAAASLVAIALRRHPIPGYPVAFMTDTGLRYDSSQIAPLPGDLTSELTQLLHGILRCEPELRPAVEVAYGRAAAYGQVPVPLREYVPLPAVTDPTANLDDHAAAPREFTVQSIAGASTRVTLPGSSGTRELIAQAALMLGLRGTVDTLALLYRGARLPSWKPTRNVRARATSPLYLVPDQAPERMAPGVTNFGAGFLSLDAGAPGTAAAGAAPGGVASAGFAAGGAGDAEYNIDQDESVHWYGPLSSHGYVFSPFMANRAISLSSNNTIAESQGKWSSVAVAMKPVSRGRLVFSVKLLSADSGCGFAIGVACAAREGGVDGSGVGSGGASRGRVGFDPRRHSLGAHPDSFAYSKTGKKGRGTGAGFEPYGSCMMTGDIVTCDADLEKGTIRFYRNGIDQGIAFDAGIQGESLFPVVCLGSNQGGRLTKVQLVNPMPLSFDRQRTHPRMVIPGSGNDGQVQNERKWATALCAHNGITRGKLTWSVKLTGVQSGGGVAVGVVDATSFDHTRSNLGASEHSWGYSKTGKKGDGMGFKDYGMAFTNGDIVTVDLDMDSGSLGFRVNGISQGVAYGPGADDHPEGEPSPLLGKCMAPAVCLGSSDGDKVCHVQLLNNLHGYELPSFDPLRTRHTNMLSEYNKLVETDGKWGTAMIAGEPCSEGSLSVGFELIAGPTGSGAAVGVADLKLFKPMICNLGAYENSWAYSKTGKGSTGNTFKSYGPAFVEGDIITVDIDMHQETINFYRNGVEQRPLARGGLAGRALLPAVCIGTSAGGHRSAFRIVPPAVIRFDNGRKSNHITISPDGRTAETVNKWSSVFALHPGQTRGVLRYAVQITGTGGVALGVADANVFKPQYQNVGAAEHSWALSKSGKISSGEGWKPYTDKLESGDIVGVELDMDTGTLKFFRNGRDLGVAFTQLDGRGYRMVPAVCLGSNYGERESAATIVSLQVPRGDADVPFPRR